MPYLFPVTCGMSLTVLLCFLVVLVRLFRSDGVLAGVFGAICGLYTFLWGWQHRDDADLRGIMILWTALLVVDAGLQLLAYSSGY